MCGNNRSCAYGRSNGIDKVEDDNTWYQTSTFTKEMGYKCGTLFPARQASSRADSSTWGTVNSKSQILQIRQGKHVKMICMFKDEQTRLMVLDCTTSAEASTYSFAL